MTVSDRPIQEKRAHRELFTFEQLKELATRPKDLDWALTKQAEKSLMSELFNDILPSSSGHTERF